MNIESGRFAFVAAVAAAAGSVVLLNKATPPLRRDADLKCGFGAAWGRVAVSVGGVTV